jgi:hypothetical protein
MLETVILVNLALCFLFGTVLLNRKYDLGVIYGRESKSFVIVILVLFAFTLNMMPLVSAADSDGDGVEDDDDVCPDENASGHDADADGCIDDSDNDGVKNDADACPFDPNDECLGTQEEENFPEDVPGCVHESAENYNSDATEDDGSCKYESDSPGFGFVLAALGCLIITFRRKL